MIFKTLFKQVRDYDKQGVNTGVRQSSALDVIAPNVVLEFQPVEQQMSNMIKYFYGTELDCPQHIVNMYTFNGQCFKHSRTKLYRWSSLYKNV